MEAGEEAQAADIGLPEPEAAAPEPEAKVEPKPLSPSSPGELGSGYGGLGPGTRSHIFSHSGLWLRGFPRL